MNSPYEKYIKNDVRPLFTKAIGKEINRFRKNKSMTGKELARLLNVSQQQISRYECGVCCITVDTLIIILDILNVSIDEFFKQVYLNVFDSEEPAAKNFFHQFVLMDN